MLKKIRFIIALWVAKASRLALRMIGKPATCTPGIIALKLCPDFLAHIGTPQTLICVTGTNGKTIVSNLLGDVLRDCGYSVTNNSYGSNVQGGVASALLTDATLTGRSKKQFGVIEVDERSSIKVYSYITPDYLVCNNIMRDSLKRNAHPDFISYVINNKLTEKTKVILNSDDLICARLAPKSTDRTYFGVDVRKPESGDPENVRDVVYCPECGHRLDVDYIRYYHIGRMSCPECGLRSPDRDFTVTDVDVDAGTLTVAHDGVSEVYRLMNDNIINIYNSCTVITVLHKIGLTYEQISGAFDRLKIVATRYDRTTVGDVSITMQFAKGQNPSACGRAFSYVAGHSGERKSVLIMTDFQESDESESVCWLYDCDMSALADPTIREIVFAGPRCRDQKLRAIMAGVPEEKIKITDTPADGVDLIDVKNHSEIFILYQLYTIPAAARAKRRLIERVEAEK
ncbi:MAG: DUF1727 domain-containing protein [Clostridia bacterium]|nr:DUF1727 domain-containing protein [Clostridia bacterium]